LIDFAIPERFWGKSLFDVRKYSPTFQIVALPREVRITVVPTLRDEEVEVGIRVALGARRMRNNEACLQSPFRNTGLA
jgi:hypothetical protein